MKKLLFICLITFGAAAAVNAQDTTSTQRDNASRSQTQDQGRDSYTDKDAISPSELPANIREQLQGQDYSSWTVSKAFRKMKNGQTVYAVELTNTSGDKKKVKFDASGNVMKEKEKKDNQ
jgi:uncharacterized membrane protein YkoI